MIRTNRRTGLRLMALLDGTCALARPQVLTYSPPPGTSFEPRKELRRPMSLK
jgi:hypothetical protein